MDLDVVGLPEDMVMRLDQSDRKLRPIDEWSVPGEAPNLITPLANWITVSLPPGRLLALLTTLREIRQSWNIIQLIPQSIYRINYLVQSLTFILSKKNPFTSST